MSRPRAVTTTAGGLPRFGFAPTVLFSAHSHAQRIQLMLEGLGGASNLLLLIGVGAGVLASYLSGLIEAGPGSAMLEVESL